MCKKIIIFVLVLASVGLVGLTQAQADTTISLDPSSSQISPQTDFTLTVKVSGAENLGKVYFEMDFDSTLLDFKDADLGAFMQANCSGYSLDGSELTPGHLYIHAQRGPDCPGQNGDGDIVYLNFSSRDLAGTTNLNFSENYVYDATGATTTASWTGGSVEVMSPIVYFSPSLTTVTASSSYSVTLKVDNVYNLNNIITDINYDSDLLTFTGATAHEPFASDPYFTADESSPGTVMISGDLTFAGGPVSGSVEVVTLNFTVADTAATSTTLTYANNGIYDDSFNELSAEWQDGILTIVQPAVVYFDSATSTITVGDNYSVTLKIDNVSNLNSVFADINYDNTILSFASATPLAPFSNDPFFTASELSPGVVTINSDLSMAGGPVDGNVSVVTLNFVAQAPGTTQFTYANNNLYDESFEEINAQWQASSVTVELPTAVISLDPATTTVSTGDTYTVTLKVDNVYNLNNIITDINYDSDLLTFVDAEPQGLFASDPFFTASESASGTVTVSGDLTGIGPLSDSSDIVVLHFVASSTAIGTSSLTYANNGIYDDTFNELPAEWQDGEVSIIDNIAPTVVIVNPTSELHYDYQSTTSSLMVSGTASDNIGFDYLEWENSATTTGGVASGTASWSVVVPLVVGDNEIIITAYDTAGNSATTSLVVSYSLPPEPAPVIADVSASNITTNSAIISWTTDREATGRVEYGLDINYSQTTATSTELITNHQITLSSLSSGTTYHYRVISVNKNGIKAVSVDYTFTTKSAGSGGGLFGGGGRGGFYLLSNQSTSTTTNDNTTSTDETDSSTKEEAGEFDQGNNEKTKILNSEHGEFSHFTSLAGLASEIVEVVSKNEAGEISAQNQAVEMSAASREAYEKIINEQTKGLTDIIRYRIAYFIEYGSPTTRILGAGERASVLNSYAAYGHWPESEADWQDVIKIANGRWPTARNEDKENQAYVDFRTIYQREPDRANPHDDAAVMIIAYGLRPAQRNLDSERAAIRIFKAIYNHNPVSAVDWDIVRAIAYSGTVR